MGSYGQSSSASKSTSYTPEQKKWLTTALNTYGPQVGKNENVYQGDRVADATTAQKSAFDFANKGGFVTTPEQTQNYFDSTIKNPALKNYAEITNPAIKEAFGGPGYWGSARAGAEAGAAKDLSSQLNSDWGNLNWQVQEANKQGVLNQYQMGTNEQNLKQAEMTANIQKFAEEHQITDPQNLSVLMSLLGMNYNKANSNSSSLEIGVSGAGGAAATTAMSDRTMKENVTPINSALDKLKMLTGYEYNYIFNPPENRNGGVMAQDVESILPFGVMVVEGVKYVKYDMVIGLLVNAVKELAQKVEEVK